MSKIVSTTQMLQDEQNHLNSLSLEELHKLRAGVASNLEEWTQNVQYLMEDIEEFERYIKVIESVTYSRQASRTIIIKRLAQVDRQNSANRKQIAI